MHSTKFGTTGLLILILSLVILGTASADFQTTYNPFISDLDYWYNASEDNPLIVNSLYVVGDVNGTGNVYMTQNWSHINYPSPCPTGTAVTTIGDTIVCSTMPTYNSSYDTTWRYFNNITYDAFTNTTTWEISI